jgi:hypothetical protein
VASCLRRPCYGMRELVSEAGAGGSVVSSGQPGDGKPNRAGSRVSGRVHNRAKQNNHADPLEELVAAAKFLIWMGTNVW